MSFLCERCGYETTNKSNIARHLRSKIPCESINSNIERQELLLKLFDKEYKTERVICPLCNKVTSKSQLSRHKKLCKAKRHKQEQVSKEIQVESEVTKEDLKAEIEGQEFFMTFLSHPKQDVLSLAESYGEDSHHTSETVTVAMFKQLKKETITMLKQQQDKLDALQNHLQQFSPNVTINQKQSQIVNATLQASTSNINHNHVTKSNKKKAITQAMRIVCWNTYIGEDIGKTLCLCCKSNRITQHNFHCGHVVAEAHGGLMHVNNLRPICAVCNNSMGTINMQVFAKENFDVEISTLTNNT